MLAAGLIEHRRPVATLLLRNDRPVFDEPVEMRLRRLKLRPVHGCHPVQEVPLDLRDALRVRVEAHGICIRPKTEAMPDKDHECRVEGPLPRRERERSDAGRLDVSVQGLVIGEEALVM